MVARLIHGHVLDVLRSMEAESVACVVTSPPYWNLRDYQLPPQVWGGDPECVHEWEAVGGRTVGSSNWNSGFNERWGQGAGARKQEKGRPVKVDRGAFCRCGAWRGCLGLEPTPTLYVDHLVEVFREIRRVLHPSGVAWLNLGDCYAGSGKGGQGNEGIMLGRAVAAAREAMRNRRGQGSGLAPKQRVMIPARAALAIQADGWWLRSEVVWQKPNAMPSSVKDRPTDSHEMLYLFAKRARYFYDRDAALEPFVNGAENASPGRVSEAERDVGGRDDGFQRDVGPGWKPSAPGRNRRTVWTICTKPYKGAHFAVFPDDLVEPCVQAGSSERGACVECGAPWTRVVKRPELPRDSEAKASERSGGLEIEQGMERTGMTHREVDEWYKANPPCTIGWKPTCKHEAGVRPCLILDPFCGSGTTGLVAYRLGRDFVGIDASASYLQLAENRLRVGGVDDIQREKHGMPRQMAVMLEGFV